MIGIGSISTRDCMNLASSFPPVDSNGGDKVAWRGGKDNCFSIFKTCLWLVANDKILTNSERNKRNMSDSASCQRCSNTWESTLHAVRDCDKATAVWKLL